ncbi:lymphotoxin-alpha [Trichomycterus rosablanca]|uniref:lymphotoxin-alpha n=1 Tax=Trichomycterus rosablanca TaxID=2290929 RepID=UPI002F35B99B
MHNPGHLRFQIMVGWCCLLSLAIVIMTVVIATGTNSQNKKEIVGMAGLTGAPLGPDLRKGPSLGQSAVNHIHLVLGPNEKSWEPSQLCYCENTSLHLQNNIVQITAGGFYYTFAQVTFTENTEKRNSEEGTVTLIANENVLGKRPRTLSEVENGHGTVSISTVIKLESGDSVRLNVSSRSLVLLKEDSKTYWGLYLLDNQNDN